MDLDGPREGPSGPFGSRNLWSLITRDFWYPWSAQNFSVQPSGYGESGPCIYVFITLS